MASREEGVVPDEGKVLRSLTSHADLESLKGVSEDDKPAKLAEEAHRIYKETSKRVAGAKESRNEHIRQLTHLAKEKGARIAERGVGTSVAAASGRSTLSINSPVASQ